MFRAAHDDQLVIAHTLLCHIIGGAEERGVERFVPLKRCQ
jgi:hypothetical protein